MCTTIHDEFTTGTDMIIKSHTTKCATIYDSVIEFDMVTLRLMMSCVLLLINRVLLLILILSQPKHGPEHS